MLVALLRVSESLVRVPRLEKPEFETDFRWPEDCVTRSHEYGVRF